MNTVVLVWAQGGKEFLDIEYFRKEWVYSEQRVEMMRALQAQQANPLTDQGEPTVKTAGRLKGEPTPSLGQ